MLPREAMTIDRKSSHADEQNANGTIYVINTLLLFEITIFSAIYILSSVRSLSIARQHGNTEKDGKSGKRVWEQRERCVLD